MRCSFGVLAQDQDLWSTTDASVYKCIKYGDGFHTRWRNTCLWTISRFVNSLLALEDFCLFERFTDRARKVMQLANQEGQRFNHPYIDSEHILLGLVKLGDSTAAELLADLNVDRRIIRLEVEKRVRSQPEMVPQGKLPQTPRAKKVIEYCMQEARDLNHKHVGTEHLLLGILRLQDGVAADVLSTLGLQHVKVREIVALRSGAADQCQSAGKVVPRPTIARSNTPALNYHGRSLPVSSQVMPCPGREDELNRMQVILNRMTRGNVLLVGEPSAGVQWLVQTLADKLRTDGERQLSARHLIEIDIASICATKKPNEAIIAIMNEASRAGDVVLYIKRIEVRLRARGRCAE